MAKKNRNRKRKRSVTNTQNETETTRVSSDGVTAANLNTDREDECKPNPTREQPEDSHRKHKKRRKKQKDDGAVIQSSSTRGSPSSKGKTHDEPVLNSSESKSSPSFPFPTEPDDHCESPLDAYKHVAPILKILCNKNRSTIYDPYYCDGSVVRNLNSLGFPDVHNVKEDCYAVWEQLRLPSFDVLLTNPPYSADHIERLMKFVTSSSFGKRPWLFLLPNWVHKKDYYVEATKSIRPFYLVPRKRYVYEPPKDFREAKKSDVHKKSSPFVSMWYIWGGTGETNELLIRRFLQSSNSTECDLARSRSALRDLRRKKR